VAGVGTVQRGQLDENYLRQWAVVLGLSSGLADALAGKIKPKHT